MTVTSDSLAPPDAFPDGAAPFFLAGPAGALEVATARPARRDARLGTAIVCHPHSLHGGSMDNKVVTMSARALIESGLNVVRFNFRGVGQSAGVYDDGNGELADLLAVVAWVRRVRPVDKLWLAGFSFGSFVAYKAVRHATPDYLILIAPPVAKWPFDAVLPPPCPCLVIQGDADDIAPPGPVATWAEGLGDGVALVRLPGADHFFNRRLMDLRGAIKHPIREALPPPDAG